MIWVISIVITTILVRAICIVIVSVITLEHVLNLEISEGRTVDHHNTRHLAGHSTVDRIGHPGLVDCSLAALAALRNHPDNMNQYFRTVVGRRNPAAAVDATSWVY